MDVSGLTPEQLRQLGRLGYAEVPAELEPLARQALGGKRETHVVLREGEQLAEWARRRKRKTGKIKRTYADFCR